MRQLQSVQLTCSLSSGTQTEAVTVEPPPQVDDLLKFFEFIIFSNHCWQGIPCACYAFLVTSQGIPLMLMPSVARGNEPFDFCPLPSMVGVINKPVSPKLIKYSCCKLITSFLSDWFLTPFNYRSFYFLQGLQTTIYLISPMYMYDVLYGSPKGAPFKRKLVLNVVVKKTWLNKAMHMIHTVMKCNPRVTCVVWTLTGGVLLPRLGHFWAQIP